MFSVLMISTFKMLSLWAASAFIHHVFIDEEHETDVRHHMDGVGSETFVQPCHPLVSDS